MPNCYGACPMRPGRHVIMLPDQAQCGLIDQIAGLAPTFSARRGPLQTKNLLIPLLFMIINAVISNSSNNKVHLLLGTILIPRQRPSSSPPHLITSKVLPVSLEKLPVYLVITSSRRVSSKFIYILYATVYNP